MREMGHRHAERVGERVRAQERKRWDREMGETERVCETENGRDKTETCVTEREREREKDGEKTCGERKKRRVEPYCIV